MYLGAWWEPRCGILNPAKLAWCWKETIAPMGVQIFENSPVIEIARDSGRVRLDTLRGRVHADKVVLATNAWSHFFPHTKRKQVPVWTHIVLTEPLNEKHFEITTVQIYRYIPDFRIKQLISPPKKPLLCAPVSY